MRTRINSLARKSIRVMALKRRTRRFEWRHKHLLGLRELSAEEITYMNKNWGLGIEFASVAKLVYDRARAAGIGRELPTEWFSQTSHP